MHTGLGMILATEPAWIIGQLDGQPWQTGQNVFISIIIFTFVCYSLCWEELDEGIISGRRMGDPPPPNEA